VELVRERVETWQQAGHPGVTRTTHELIQWWTREGREKRLFFAQIEAALTIIFLKEARADFLQGISVPRDEPSDDRQEKGYTGFERYSNKMATGSGKTTVMGMLAAWSILNKVNDRSNARFSDVVLVVCPNVTIRGRLGELDPERGEASIYRTRDLVPPHLMPLLTRGKVLVTNWHVFEPQTVQTGGVTAKVTKAGSEVRTKETIHIGPKTTTARGSRYLTLEDFQRQVNAGLLTVLPEEKDRKGDLLRVKVESVRYVKSDTALINEVLGREVDGKQNILVLNDEAHHAYRIKRDEPEPGEEDGFGEEEEAEEFFREATVWIDGLDKIHKHRGINFCVDLSATPYFLGRVGQETNKPFPWVVSDFGLVDAIEAGLGTGIRLAQDLELVLGRETPSRVAGRHLGVRRGRRGGRHLALDRGRSSATGRLASLAAPPLRLPHGRLFSISAAGSFHQGPSTSPPGTLISRGFAVSRMLARRDSAPRSGLLFTRLRVSW